MSKKFYAVKKGRVSGVYKEWNDCKKQVDGFSGAVYKSFTAYQDAIDYIELNNIEEIDGWEVIAYVDGSYSDEYKMYSYGCVIIANDKKLELNGKYNHETQLEMRNVAGEILGAQRAIEWAVDNKFKSILICFDYEGIERWANKLWSANKPGTKAYQKFIDENRKNISIGFNKVKAHSGNKFNERADELAKEALNSFSNEIESKLELEKIVDYSHKYLDLFNRLVNNRESKSNSNIHYLIGTEYIGEKELVKFIKDIWKDNGCSIKEMDDFKIRVNGSESKLIWTIKSKSGETITYSANIS